jgi:glycosidase
VGWDSINANDAIVLGANQQMTTPGTMFDLMQNLIALKHSTPALIKGSFQAIQTGNTQVMAFRRILDNDVINIYINFGTSQANVTATGTILFASDNATLQTQPSFSVLVTRN